MVKIVSTIGIFLSTTLLTYGIATIKSGEFNLSLIMITLGIVMTVFSVLMALIAHKNNWFEGAN